MSGAVNVTGAGPREVAAEAWGAPLPDWVEAVVAEVERTSGRRAAERIDYSASVVSQVLRGTYRGDVGRVEAKVRGALMGEAVACPGYLGMEIGRDRCLREQAMDNTGTSAARTRVFHACRSGCPHSRLRGDDDAAV